ncbi:MAG: MCE family protein [Acidimicrobiales bacterium]
MPVIPRRFGASVAVVLLVLGAAGCDPQTATSPTGDTNLLIEFPDAQDLVRGHTVQLANVRVGSVRAIDLIRSESSDDYAAQVEISIVNSVKIPLGTTAVLRRTSLLGEHFVDLVVPDGEATEFYEDGDRIEDAEVLDDFEDVALAASEVLGAVAGRDLTTIVDTAHTALAGRGKQLNALIADLGSVVGVIADQRTDLAATADGLAALGAALAPGSQRIGALIDDLAGTTTLLAEHRERIVTALEDLTGLATTMNDVVLEPHTERLTKLLADLDPVLQRVVDNRQLVDTLIVDLLRFTENLPAAIDDKGRLNAFAWLLLEGAMTATSAGPSTSATPREATEAFMELLRP